MDNNVCSREELKKELESYNKERDLQLKVKLLEQKEKIVCDIQTAIGKIPKIEESMLIKGIGKSIDEQEYRLESIDDKLIKNDEAHIQLRLSLNAAKNDIKIMKESLKPLNKIFWSVLISMILGVLGAVLSLVLSK